MALGSFAAIGQRNPKRLMAYSSIGSVGYILLGVASGSEKGIQSVVFYLAIYIVMTLGVFAIILLGEHLTAWEVAGGALILAAVVLERSRRPPVEPPGD